MQAWNYAIWFVGAGVWLLVAALAERMHATARTLGAMLVAIVFFGAGMFFARSPGPRSRRNR